MSNLNTAEWRNKSLLFDKPRSGWDPKPKRLENALAIAVGRS
jgi:hypothetical protein